GAIAARARPMAGPWAGARARIWATGTAVSVHSAAGPAGKPPWAVANGAGTMSVGRLLAGALRDFVELEGVRPLRHVGQAHFAAHVGHDVHFAAVGVLHRPRRARDGPRVPV